MTLHSFVRPVPASYRQFQVVYLVLVLNFLFPAISYITHPELAIASLARLEALLGGRPLPAETGHLWHMLAVGNVMTLAWLCFLLLINLRRFYPALPGLVFLKAFSACYSAAIAWYNDLPVFYAILALDGVTSLAMVVFAVRAWRDIDGGPTGWWTLLLPRPAVVATNLERLAAAGYRVPTLFQVWLGTLYAVHRLLFRSETIGLSRDAIRPGLRAHLLAFRPIRFPFTQIERVVFPFDLSGLGLEPDDLIRHLVGSHHDGKQFVYDLQLLAVYGKLETLRDAAAHVVSADTPRTRYLRDLCVFEGYHERLLAAAEDALRGEIGHHESTHPDVSLRAWLSWCADRPPTPRDAWRTWWGGEWSFTPPLT